MSDKQYPIGGYAPGFYTCTCCICKNEFQGDKRAFQCEPCATKALRPFESAGVNYLKFEKAARKFWQMFYGKEFPYKFSEWFWEKRNAFSSGLGVKSAVWVKATERLPDNGGIDNKVIVRGVLNEQGYANHFFVAYGFRNFSKEKQEMYFEYGSKSFLTNDLEWLDESPSLAPDQAGKEDITDHEHEKEIMMQAFDKVRKIFEGRTWIMEGRGSYPYDDDRYKEEVRYMYDEFDELFKDTWKNIKSKTFEYRNKIIEQYKKESGKEDAVAPLTDDEIKFMEECDIYPHANGTAKILTENDEGAYLENADLIKLANILYRYAKTDM